MGTKKGQDIDGNVVGQEAAKLRQLKVLGYSPIVIPFDVQSNFGHVMKTMGKMLRGMDMDLSLPNLDDGYRERNRKF